MKKGTGNNIYRTREEIRRFFKQQGVTYLKHTRVAWDPLYGIPLEESSYYRENQATFTDLNRLYSTDIRNSRLASVYIKKIDDKLGFGVFAAAPIKKDGFVGEYAGVVQIAAEDAGRELTDGGYESDFSWYYVDEIRQAPDLEINGRFESNEMRFVNHSELSNLEVEHTLLDGQWIIFFRAAVDIKIDDQLTISYGERYWEDGFRTLRNV